MSSPFTGPINPFIRSHISHLQGDRESVVSSPSHHPLPLPTRRAKKPKKTSGASAAAGGGGPSATASHVAPATGGTATQRGPREPPPRVASTLPPSSDTDQQDEQDEDDGDLTEGRDERFRTRSAPPLNHLNIAAALTPNIQGRSSTDDDEESDLWLEEDDDDDSRLDIELHPGYIPNLTKRNRRFQDKLGEIIRLVSIFFAEIIMKWQLIGPLIC